MREPIQLRQRFRPIEVDGYRATWEAVPMETVFGFMTPSKWVIRHGEAFVGLADTPRQAMRVIRWAWEQRPAA